VIDFESYRNAFQTIKLERSANGILEMSLHYQGGPYVWDAREGAVQHKELTDALRNIARDEQNRVVILMGTGESFSGPPANGTTWSRGDARHWDHVQFLENHLLEDLLDIAAPVIGILNGPAYRHAEIPFTADIVLASEDAVIQDSAHFTNRMVPGDGIALLFPMLMGWNRAKYFHLTGQKLCAEELKHLGLVNEVLPRDQLLPRARALAEQLIANNPLVLRYTRAVFTGPVKALLRQHIQYGLAYEALAAVDESTRPM
jgi:enoyl-CoA hydratase/carnithine racemase